MFTLLTLRFVIVPFTVMSPETIKSLPIVVVDEALPMFTVPAFTVPKFIVVAVVPTLNVALVVVISPPK